MEWIRSGVEGVGMKMQKGAVESRNQRQKRNKEIVESSATYAEVDTSRTPLRRVWGLKKRVVSQVLETRGYRNKGRNNGLLEEPFLQKCGQVERKEGETEKPTNEIIMRIKI